VCVGDFFQLPPVPNEYYQDPGRFAFESEAWNRGLVHKIILATVVRQNDTDLIQAVNELERGVPSDFTDTLMTSLGRPLPPGDAPVILYATNFEVDWHNSMALELSVGRQHIYRSTDTGPSSQLRHITGKKCLMLKVNSPVILLKNLSRELVNGSRGKVIQLDDDGPTVDFNGKAVKLHQESFTVYDTVKRVVSAERSQYPVALAFALTIHKSQGLTLPRCQVHCTNIRQPGQLGVAVGRATSVEGLRVLDYHPASSVKHRKAVGDFVDSPGDSFSSDLSCCQNVSVDLLDDCTIGIEEQLFCEFSDDSEFDEAELDEIQQLEELAVASRPQSEQDGPFDKEQTKGFLDDLMSKYTVTVSQKDMNRCLTDLMSTEKTRTFLNEQYHTLSSFVPERPVDDTNMPIQKYWNTFYSQCQSHLSSGVYLTACTQLFSPAKPNHLVCSHIMTAIRKMHVLSMESGKKKAKVTSDTSAPAEIPPSAYGKIRYVGGMNVAKLKYKNMNKVRQVLQSGNLSNIHLDNKVKVDMLQAITISQSVILETSKYTDSLSDTFRKQNLSCGLTNISDTAFEFFRELEKSRLPLYTQFQVYGGKILTHVEESIRNDSILYSRFASLIEKSGYKASHGEFEFDCSVPATMHGLTRSVCLEELYSEIIHSYLSVTDNEFRRNILSELGHKKTMEHRKKVLTKRSATRAGTSSVVSVESIEKDTTADKELSHLKVKSMVLEK
jgi:hypothetical protein